MRKLHDLVLYSDDDWYSCFPSVIALPGGGLLAAFRRAPNRLRHGGRGNSHIHPNSYLMMARSADGIAWGPPELLFAHPLGGSQDPGLYRLRDGTLLCTSYLWMLLGDGADTGSAYHRLDQGSDFAIMGGYLLRSTDQGRTWQGPFYPRIEGLTWQPSLPGWAFAPLNRGGLLEHSSGRLLWACQRKAGSGSQTEEHLIWSDDKGLTWHYGGLIAADEKVVFNESQLYETPAGDLVCIMRTANFDDRTAVARSSDGGKTWRTWQDTGLVGHPHHALRLPDGRVWLVYGYRHEPFGIRGRVLDPECTRFDSPEVVLRDDGGGHDLGYPWSCLLPDGNVLSVYYFHRAADGPTATRHIAGTILSL